MKLTFEANLEYQREAVAAVVGLFEGQPKGGSVPGPGVEEAGTLALPNAVGNRLAVSDAQICENLREVQKANCVPADEAFQGMNFSVEMETGTGKTYVYLRTIYELNKQYGFKKFVIVVPSIAIREGVLKNLQITHAHFQNLYGNVPAHYSVYDSSKVSALRGFAASDNIEILVLGIDSFAKDENVINRPNDKLSGREPIEFLRAVSPIVIMDEPQNMETEKRAAAVANLNPLCTLRYSATHKNRYNLVYSLNPVKAYDLGLVKQIVVSSVVEENSANTAFVALESVKATKTRITAKMKIHAAAADGVQVKSVSVRAGDDLHALSGGREVYADGYVVEEIDAENECVTFSNGNAIRVGQTQGALTDEIMRTQIAATIREHLERERKLHGKGVKVLSLFFIDHVANYRGYDADGNATKGKFAEWFEEIYSETIKNPHYAELRRVPAAQTHNGYFSQDRKGKLKDTNGETQADDDTYSLIMRDKEKLLDPENPLRFIFSHSALREGWDNPNVFQICTLNETKSEAKKRQEIGRGLRLAVNADGRRIYDRAVNQLVVVANESYADFAKALQSEIETECGVAFGGRIKNARERRVVKYRKGFEADPRFLEIWNRIKAKTTYRVNYSTEDLISAAVEAVAGLPEIRAPQVRTTRVGISMCESGVSTRLLAEAPASYGSRTWRVPDILGYIQCRTELTRGTIGEILKKSGRLEDALRNPQLFLDSVVGALRRTLHKLMIDGIQYRKIGSAEYEMRLFEAQDMEIYLNKFTFKVGSADAEQANKTIYEEYVPLDSEAETQFARDCETSEQVKFYFKLPEWFKIPTPVGNYNPDWAIVFEGEKKIYFVTETKFTGTPTVDFEKLRDSERRKIHCGEKHFAVLSGVEYRVAQRLSDLTK